MSVSSAESSTTKLVPDSTLVISRREVRELLDLDDCIDAVDAAFRALADGRAIPSDVLGVHVAGGGFHIKTAGLLDPAAYFAAKLNGNFGENGERFGLPRIQGLILLADARHGYPLAIMDSVEITALRTAAATAVAARYLARPDSRVATICGCGQQGEIQLEAMLRVCDLEAVYAFDVDSRRARGLCETFAGRGLETLVADELASAAGQSDVIVLCTPALGPILGPGQVRPGTFIAAVGADSEEKQELDPRLVAESTLVVDHLEQCATIGELHHALESGAMRPEDVHAELHQVVAGHLSGRTSADEVTIFDSTGVAIEDVATAALVYDRALERGMGSRLELL